MANTKVTSRVLANDAVLTANIADDQVTTAKIADDVALGGNPTTTTQTAGNNTTRIATTAFVTTAVANIVDSAPDALNTLNELAAAMGDDANFSTTITNSIAAKLPLAGGTMTGALDLDGQELKLDADADTSITADTDDVVDFKVGGTDRLRLAGNNLFLNGATDARIQLGSGGAGANTVGNNTVHIRGDGVDAKYMAASGGDHIFESNGGHLVTMKDDGKVGIGTTSPQAVLHLKGAGNELRFERTNFDPLQVGIGTANSQNGLHLTNITDSTIPFSLHENAPTNSLVIDSSGRLLIGETSNNDGAAVQIDANSAGATVYSLRVENSNTATDVYNGIRLIQGASGSAVGVMATGGSSTSNVSYRNVFHVGTQNATSLVLGTNDTERMRILSTGLVAIGTTVNTVARMHIQESESRDCLRLTNTRNPSSSAPYVATFGFNYQPNNGTSTFLACQDDLDGSPTNRCIIQSNGGIANYQSNNSNLSDARLKTDIQDAPNALDIINNLKVRTFKYHDQTNEKIHTGLIAQEAETVDLSLVNQDGWADKAPDGEEPYKSIYSTDLMFKMLKAIQEQQEQIETLKKEVEELKGG